MCSYRRLHPTLISFALLVSALSQTFAAHPSPWLDSREREIGVTTNVSKNPTRSVEPAMAVEADGKIHLAWMDLGPAGLQILYSSSLDGIVWTRPNNVSDSQAASAYPSIAVNEHGVVHLTWMEGKGDDFEIYYSQLKAGEWSPPRNVSNLKGISQRPKMAIDAAGKVHVIWYDNTGGFFELFHCWRDGETWSKPTNTKLVDWFITHNPGYGMAAGLAADLNGHLHLVWVDIYEQTQDLFHSRWNGESWSKPGIISRTPVRPRELFVDTDPSGNVHLTWEDNGEVWYCHSDGSTWSAPLAISDGVQRSGSPALCLAHNGDVHLAWSGSLFGNVHLFYRRFDGKDWSRTAKLSRAEGRPDGVTVSFQNPKTLHVAWMDDSPGNVDIFHKQGFSRDITEAARLDPQHAEEFYNRGRTWLRIRELDKALKDFTEAITVNSRYAEAYDSRGAVWLEMGELDNALKDYTEAIRLHPEHADAYCDRGTIWWSKGEWDNAIKDFTAAIKLNPKNAGFYYNRGSIWSTKAEWGNAIEDFDQSVRTDPSFERSHNALAWLLATCPVPKYRDGKRSVEHATTACELTDWEKGLYLNTLAAAYAELGDFDQAIEWQSKACSMVPQSVRAEYQARLDLYMAGKPYRQPGLD